MVDESRSKLLLSIDEARRMEGGCTLVVAAVLFAASSSARNYTAVEEKDCGRITGSRVRDPRRVHLAKENTFYRENVFSLSIVDEGCLSKLFFQALRFRPRHEAHVVVKIKERRKMKRPTQEMRGE